MKRYIAINGNGTSGIVTKEKAIEWASNQISKQHGVDKIHIAEVIEVVERTVPAVAVKSFFVELNEPVAKAA